MLILYPKEQNIFYQLIMIIINLKLKKFLKTKFLKEFTECQAGIEEAILKSYILILAFKINNAK